MAAATERSRRAPWGLCGGDSGGTAAVRIYRDGQIISDNPKPRNVKLQADDIVEMVTAGAGGYGPAAERNPQVVKREYEEGIVDEKWIADAGIVSEI